MTQCVRCNQRPTVPGKCARLCRACLDREVDDGE